jgi:hypothetical protein
MRFEYVSAPAVSVVRAAAFLLFLLLPACSRGDEGAEVNRATDATTTQPVPAAGAAASAGPLARIQDPCTLMSSEEVGAAAGMRSSTGQRSTSGGAQVCTWTDADGKSAVVQIYPSAERYDQSRTAFESLYGGAAEEVQGVAEQAFYIGGRTGGIPTATVSARKGPTALSVQVMEMNGEPETLRGQALELMQRMAQKL